MVAPRSARVTSGRRRDPARDLSDVISMTGQVDDSRITDQLFACRSMRHARAFRLFCFQPNNRQRICLRARHS